MPLVWTDLFESTKCFRFLANGFVSSRILAILPGLYRSKALELLGGPVECETIGVGWECIFLMDRHHFQL